MSSDLTAEINIVAVDAASNVLRNVGQAFSGLFNNLPGPAKVAAGALSLVGGFAIGVGTKAVQMAADFQESMSKVAAYVGLTKNQTDNLGNSILSLATQMGQSPKAMADALYPIMSSGYDASQSLKILKLSAETAAASGANMATIADALTTSLKAMHAPASNAGIYMDDINKIVSLGKGQVSDYAAVIGKLSLAAGSAQVPFGDMGAALATLTTHGFPSVAQAANSLGNLFTQIGPKVDTLAAHAKKLGLSFDESKFKSMDLSDKLAYLQQVTGGNQGELLKLVGGSTLALKAFNAMEGSTADLTSNMDAMNGAAGTTNDVFQKTYGDWNNSVSRLNATIQTLLIKIGQALLPILTPVLNAVTGLIAQLTALTGAGNAVSPMISNISGMMGIMAGNWSDFGSQIQSILGGPFKEFGSTMGQLLPGFISQLLRALNDAQMAFMDVATSAATIIGPALKVLGQVFKGAQGVIETVLNAIEGQFLPALHNLVSAIAPVIVGIISWVANSGLVPAIFAGISGAVSFLMPILAGLINGVASFVGWMEKGSAPAKALGIALLAVGAALAVIKIGNMIAGIANMIAGIVEMIPYLIMWVAVTWGQVAAFIAEAIAEMAANWPIYLIIAAIAAVIAITVLLVQHWSQVVSFLQGTWSAFAGWFMSALRATAAFFVAMWDDIVSGLQAAIAFIINIVRTGFLIWLSIITFPIRMVAMLFIWLYQHNRYFQMLIDAIVGIVRAGMSWLSNAFHIALSFVVARFIWLKTQAETLWAEITGAITAKVAQAIAWLRGAWNTAIAVLAGVWATIASNVSAMWNKITGIFALAWSYIATPLHNLWDSITGFVSNWGGQALQWGQNLIKMLAQGIASGAGAIWNAVTGIAKNIWSALGFHSPAKAGPGADADKWMPNLVSMLSSGLVAGVPKMQAAVSAVAAPLTVLAAPASVSAPSSSSSPSSSSNITNIINVTVPPSRSKNEAQDVANEVLKVLSRQLNRSGNLVTWTSGGRS